jgi:predicted RNA-binding protein YlxR (DUF448 family)
MTREAERTCIGCRRRAKAAELVRVGLLRPDGQLVFWGPGHARPAGRGASLHADAGCLRTALKAGAFARALRARVGNVDEADLLQQLITAAPAASRVG